MLPSKILDNDIDNNNNSNNMDNNSNKSPNNIENEFIKTFHNMEDKILEASHNKIQHNIQSKINVNEVNMGAINKIESDQFKNNTEAKKRTIDIVYNTNKFSFIDNQGNYIGSFTINEFIKYFSSMFDPKNQFMNNIDEHSYNNAKIIIKNFIGKVEFNKKIKYGNIILKDAEASPFMNNIGLLVKLNDLLYKFEKSKLIQELNYVDKIYRQKIEIILKKLMYMLLNYTIILITEISTHLKDSPNKNRLKNELTTYSIGLVYRISQFVQSQLAIIITSNNELEKMIINIEKIRMSIESKMDKLIDLLKEQNTKIISLQHQYGGDIGEYSTTSSDKIITISDKDSCSTSHFSAIYDI